MTADPYRDAAADGGFAGLAADQTVLRRDAELSRLDRLVTVTAAGGGGLCWLQGEPGIGKSAMADAALARAAALDCAVFRAAASAPPAGAAPAGAVATAPALELMARCLEISAGSPDPARTRIAALLGGTGVQAGAVITASLQILELVDRLCADRPVVLAVEDLQWADEASLLAWSQLARVAGQIPLLLIASARATPRRDTVRRLRELVTQRDGTVLDLGPLDSGGVAELAARAGGGPPGPRLAALLARAGGNPGYVTGLLSAVARDGLLTVSAGLAELRRDLRATPAAVTSAIEARLRYLPGDTRAALRVAAFLGPEFGAAEWAAAAGRSVLQVSDMIEAVTADGLIDGAGDRLRFWHELVRQVLASQVAQADRAAMHAGIARNLARAGQDARTVAGHLRMLPDPLPDWAVDWLAGLGEPTLALVSPADLLGRALVSAGADDRRWEALASRLARALLRAGGDEEAIEVAEQVAGRAADPSLVAEMRIAVIRAALRAGHPARGRAVLTGAAPGDPALGVPAPRAPALGAPAPQRWQARLAAWSALLLHADGQISEGAAAARDALASAIDSGDPLAIASTHYAAAACGDARARAGHIRAALDALRGRDPESAELRMILLAAQITLAAAQDEPGTLDGALREALPLTAEAGSPGDAKVAVLSAAACAGYRYGRWDDALAHVGAIGGDGRAAIRPGRRAPSPDQGIAALIALRRGDRAQADAALADLPVPSHGAPGGPPCHGAPGGAAHPVHRVTEVLALRAEADGDLGLAVALMSAWLSAPVGLGAHERHDDTLPCLIRMASAAAQEETARAAADLSRADAAADPSAGRTAAARLCQALVDDDAAGLLGLAGVYEGYGWLPMRAFTLEEASVRLAAAGELAGARKALTGAVRGYAALSAAADIRRADTRLRCHGVRRGSRSIQRRPATGWDALTPAERRIADLAGQGMSNPDIAARLHLSRRTVQNHLTRVLAKLGLSSRLEIVRAAAYREQPATLKP